MIVNTDPFKRFIEIWLYLMLLLIILIVFIGGLTRLTDSGLSITQWELIRGFLPPLNTEQWTFYFDEYKKTTEYKKEIVDKKRIEIILKKINQKSKKLKIDTKITNRIWKNMIWSYIDYENRNFKKK